MKKYFYLQWKRTLKIFPFVLIAALILFAGLAGVFLGLMRMQRESDDVQKFKVGIVGDTADSYLDFGLSALKTLDDTRFSLELERLEESEAQQALAQYDISAYLVFPEGFMDAALLGDVKTIRLITRAGDGGLVMIFKEEIAQAVTYLLAESQKGVFGVQTALDSNGYQQLSYQYLNEMNVEYIDFVLHRSDLYRVTELGISDSLTLQEYFLCSFVVFLLLLIGLPYAAVFIKKDWTLNRILASGTCGASKQVACEAAAYTGVMLLLTAVIMTASALFMGKITQQSAPLEFDPRTLALHLIPAIIIASAFHMMLFELSGNIVNGILLQFFCSVSLCYAAGCFYPIYAFPKAVQSLAPFLPTGLMRSYLASGITGERSAADLFGIFAFTSVFLAITVAVRKHKITAKVG